MKETAMRNPNPTHDTKPSAWSLIDTRDLALQVGAHLTRTDRDKPEMVLAAAKPVSDWLLAATDGDDMSARRRAVRQHLRSLPNLYLGSPEQFLDEARRYYTYLIGADQRTTPVA